MDNDFFAPPPFNADTALVQLRRALRELRPLAERGDHWTYEGLDVLQLTAADGAITARLAKKPLRSPDWETRTCRNAADVRKLQDDVKRRLAQWADE